MKTKTATPNGSSRKRDALNNTSRCAQQGRLLKRLIQGPADTLLLRRHENILMPAARVKELKELGHVISTQRITLIDDYGRAHRGIALYTLVTLAHSAKTLRALKVPEPSEGSERAFEVDSAREG